MPFAGAEGSATQICLLTGLVKERLNALRGGGGVCNRRAECERHEAHHGLNALRGGGGVCNCCKQ